MKKAYISKRKQWMTLFSVIYVLLILKILNYKRFVQLINGC